MNILSPLPLGLLTLIALGIGLSWSLKVFSPEARRSLGGLCTGVLVFLFVESLAGACTAAQPSLKALFNGLNESRQGLGLILCLSIGFVLGLTAMVGLKTQKSPPFPLDLRGTSPKIALLVGLYNLAQGFSIHSFFGPSMATSATGFAAGFALHQAFLGLAIAGPLIQQGRPLSWKALLAWALLAGMPFFAGAWMGGLGVSAPIWVFILAATGGGLLYVLKELWVQGDGQKAPTAAMALLVLGFTLGWTTEAVPPATAKPSPNAVQAASNVVRATPRSEADEERFYGSLDAPFLTRKEINAQDQASNDILHCRAMHPRILADGTKEFDLTASSFIWQLYNTARVPVWGYNGQVPGPLIRLKVGDKAKFVVKNELPQNTIVHWHGLAVPNSEDGVPGITQRAIPPGGVFTYRFKVTPQMAGTHLYHTHFNESFQMDQGLHGVLIVDPPKPPKRSYDVEALYEMGAFKVGGLDQENVFTLDGKAFPEAPVLKVPLGARVLLRLVNASAENDHVMHLHGYTFKIVALDGNPVSHPVEANTVNLAPSQTADVLFTATNPGRWMFHCHILDHTINPGPQGEGDANTPANMGGLMTYVEVLPPSQVQTDFLAAGSLYSDPTCNRGLQ